jgi:hypothetical protein
MSSLLRSPNAKIQQGRNKSPSWLRGEKSIEPEQGNSVGLEEATMTTP